MKKFICAICCALSIPSLVHAGDVEIVSAELTDRGVSWNVAVTLKHADTGWDHYADSWRIVDEQGKLLDTRVLAHPHVEEQPFTRSIFQANIPEGTKVVYIEATDKVHGLSPDRLRIDFDQPEGERYKIRR